jgi:hypothetical protein
VIDRLRALYHTPIRDEQRKPLFALVALILIAAGVGFSVMGADDDGPTRETARPAVTPPPPPRDPVPAPVEEDLAEIPVPSEERAPDEEEAPSPEQVAGAQEAAEGFLDEYLAWTYGRGEAQEIANATPQLRDDLAEARPRVPANERDREADVQTLTLEGASNRKMGLQAVVDDGRRVYTVSLAAALDDDDEWVVSEVGP